MLKIMLAQSTKALAAKQHKFSHVHWLIFIVNKRTDTWIYNLCDVKHYVATSESGQFDSLLQSRSQGLSSYYGRQFFMRLSCYRQWFSSQHCQSSLCTNSAIASWIHSYVGNVVTKFMINNRTDVWKADVHLFFTITNCQTGRSRSLPHRRNYKFICLSTYWR